jgi:general secretion pathway protein A
MYQEYYKMNALPFTGLPNLNFFFGGDGYKNALASLVTSIDARHALIAVLGPEGLGKTTIAQMVEVLLGDRVKVIRVADPFAGCADILTFVASRLGLEYKGSSHLDLIDKIYSALLALGSD